MSEPVLLSPLTAPGQRHLLHQVLRFSRSLHEAGLAINPASLIDLGRCLDYIDIRNRADFHAAARATLVSAQADLPLFDKAFEAFWAVPDATERPVRERMDEAGEDQADEQGPTGGLTLERAGIGEGQPAGEPGDDPLAWSAHEVLVRKNFKHMSEQELDEARRLIAGLIALLASTASRRITASRKRSELDLRRMLRRNALRAGDGIEFRYRRRRIKRTRLLLLCDVSGSMERYSRFLIQFIYALRQQLARIDVAVFSTRMTVITHLLRWRSVERSLQEVAAEVRDWGGGTDIGSSLRAFNDRFSSGMHRTHSVAIVLSDGWDRGDAARMREEMQRLHQRVRRLLWLNPLLGHADYQPLCQGMRTAMPFIDDFLPGHNLESLAGLLRHLRTIWR